MRAPRGRVESGTASIGGTRTKKYYICIRSIYSGKFCSNNSCGKYSYSSISTCRRNQYYTACVMLSKKPSNQLIQPTANSTCFQSSSIQLELNQDTHRGVLFSTSVMRLTKSIAHYFCSAADQRKIRKPSTTPYKTANSIRQSTFKKSKIFDTPIHI